MNERESTHASDDELLDAVREVAAEQGIPVIDLRAGDDALIDQALQEWNDKERVGTISDTVARVIASQMHDGQPSELYSFASTGRIDVEAMADEVFSTLFMGEDADKMNDRLEALGLYFIRTGDRDAVEGWAEQTKW